MKEFGEIIAGLTKLGFIKEAKATSRFVEILAELGTVPESIHAEEAKEEEEHVIFTGKLKTKPREGRQTTKGKPTAWAIFATHDAEQEEAKYTAPVLPNQPETLPCLFPKTHRLPSKATPPKPATEEGRRDRLHVFAILNHPNKRQK